MGLLTKGSTCGMHARLAHSVVSWCTHAQLALRLPVSLGNEYMVSLELRDTKWSCRSASRAAHRCGQCRFCLPCASTPAGRQPGGGEFWNALGARFPVQTQFVHTISFPICTTEVLGCWWKTTACTDALPQRAQHTQGTYSGPPMRVLRRSPAFQQASDRPQCKVRTPARTALIQNTPTHASRVSAGPPTAPATTHRASS